MNADMPFWKMHGAGNDFVMIDDREERFELGGEEVAAICDRHRGVGADGLILIRPSREAEFRMVYFNSDGGEASMCGNGARCAAKFAVMMRAAGPSMRFMTGAGLVEAEVAGDDVTVTVGPVTGLRLDMRLSGVEGSVHFADSGVPHAVIFDEEAAALDGAAFREAAREIRRHPAFGKAGANVNFAVVEGAGSIRYRTYERGVEDETQACGTGAMAVSVAAARLGLVDPPVSCRTSGGDLLRVSFEPEPGGASGVKLSGPAEFSFHGVIGAEDHAAENM